LPRRRFLASAGPPALPRHRFAVPIPAVLPQARDPRRPQLPDLHKLGMRRMNGPIVAFAQTIQALGAARASAL